MPVIRLSGGPTMTDGIPADNVAAPVGQVGYIRYTFTQHARGESGEPRAQACRSLYTISVQFSNAFSLEGKANMTRWRQAARASPPPAPSFP